MNYKVDNIFTILKAIDDGIISVSLKNYISEKNKAEYETNTGWGFLVFIDGWEINEETWDYIEAFKPPGALNYVLSCDKLVVEWDPEHVERWLGTETR